MHCPKCGMPGAKADGAASCPRCGIVFGKLKSGERPRPRPRPTPGRALPKPAEPTPSRTPPLVNILLLVIALGAAAMWAEQLVTPERKILSPKEIEEQRRAAHATTTIPRPPEPRRRTQGEIDAIRRANGRSPRGSRQPSVPGEGYFLVDGSPNRNGDGDGNLPSEAPGPSLRELPRLDPKTITPAILARAIDLADRTPNDRELRDYVANAHVYLSAREVTQRQYQQALRYLDGAETWGASRADVATIRAMVYGHQESWSAAEKWARDALAAGTREPAEMHHLIGKAQYFREELSRAVASFEQALAIDDDPRFRASLAAAARDSRSASNFDQKRLSHFIVSYEGETMETTGRMVLDTMERSWASLVSQFGFEPTEPVVVLLYSRSDYAQMGGPHWSAGYFDGKIRVPVRGLTRVDPRLQSTLHHELAHAFIHAQSGQRAPRWLHEGIAQYVDGTDSRRGGPLLAQALDGGRTLEGCVRSASCDVRVFYAAAASAVEYMIQQRGMGGIKDLVQSLGTGKDMDAAMRDVLGKDQSSFLRDWEHFVRRRFG